MRRVFLLFPAVVACLLVEGCHDNKPVPAPAPAPEPASATASGPTINTFTVAPGSMESGQSASLSWSVSDSDSVHIDPEIGEVEPSGKRTVSPAATTTYKLIAKNVHGSSEASATVTVTGSETATAAGTAGDKKPSAEFVNERLRDLHFEYNQDVIRPEDQPLLSDDASMLKSLLHSDPSLAITIEGHCDERGSPAYNLALADRRASYVRDSLIKLGVPGDKLNVVGYGDERPLCLEATEQCYGRNRRAHFRLAE